MMPPYKQAQQIKQESATLIQIMGTDIWCQMTHITSKIKHQLIYPILVSQEASWPQQSDLLVWLWLNNCFKIKK